MFRKLIIILLPISFLLSCSGVLWDGKSTNELNITISNPFYIPSASARIGRALALQGKYLYIELALIEDQAGYENDADKLVTGNGSWVETAWGGHAIVALDFSNGIETLDATFVDVPRGSDLKARAILETSKSVLETNLFLYDGIDTFPICQTYDFDQTDYESKTWKLIPSEELTENSISLVVRPVPNGSQYFPVFSPMDIDLIQNDIYIDNTGTVTYNNSEPQPGETKFTHVEIYMNTGEVDYDVQDIAFYLLTEASLTQGLALPGIASLHDRDGNADFYTGGDDFSLNPTYPYRSFSVFKPDLISYSTSGFFISSTVFPGPELEDGAVYVLNNSDKYDVSYGVLYEGAGILAEMRSAPDDFHISWSIPPGFLSTDFDFRIIHLDSSSSLLKTDLESIEEIFSYQTLIDNGVDTGWLNWTSLDYTNPSYPYSANDWVIILGRTPNDGEPFIWGRNTIVDNAT